jgi:hypothetical protein
MQAERRSLRATAVAKAEGQGMKREGTIRLILSGLWVALVAGYWAWAAISFSGLYRWLAEWQVAQWGGYYERATATLPALLMAAPAFVYLRRRAENAQAEAAAQLGPEVAEGRRLRRSVRGTAAFGLVAILVGAGAYLLSLSVPDGSGPAVPFDVATLGSGPVPQERVTIRGEVDPEASVAVVETRGVSSRNAVYAGFRPEGESAKDAPVRLFIERSTGSSEPTIAQGFLPDQTGFLVENGLPDPALREFEAQGIRLASPHYVLRTSAGARRDTYYVVAAVAGFLGFVCLLVAGLMAFQGRAVLRRA